MRLDGREGAPALVLACALGTTPDAWEPQVAALAGHFFVVRYDYLARSTVEEHAGDVLRLADELGRDRFSFCGLSLGGMVGMWLAADAPERVDRLVLVGTSARFGLAEDWTMKAKLVRRRGMAAVAQDALDKWFTARYGDRGRFLRMQLDFPVETYACGLDAIGAFDFRDRLESIRAPTLVVVGEQDAATPPSDARFLADAIPAARLLVLEGAAHLANVERPDAFNRAVVRHLRDTRPPGGRL